MSLSARWPRPSFCQKSRVKKPPICLSARLGEIVKIRTFYLHLKFKTFCHLTCQPSDMPFLQNGICHFSKMAYAILEKYMPFWSNGILENGICHFRVMAYWKMGYRWPKIKTCYLQISWFWDFTWNEHYRLCWTWWACLQDGPAPHFVRKVVWKNLLSA